jgi:hypothetical protein
MKVTSREAKVIRLNTLLNSMFNIEGPKRRTREGGSEWVPIKILLEGDGNSNKINTGSNTRL